MPREAFPYFILTQMPAGMRGLVIAGIMATAMGSLSTALNALGTSFARDFVLPWREARGPVDGGRARARAALEHGAFRRAHHRSSALATAYYMAHNPTAAIIPLVLGILGFTFGSLLGIFLVAVLTRTRGSDFGNVVAMICGFAAVIFFSNGDLQKLVGFHDARAPDGAASSRAWCWRFRGGSRSARSSRFLVAILFSHTAGRRVEQMRRALLRTRSFAASPRSRVVSRLAERSTEKSACARK